PEGVLDYKLSALMISPPATEPRACQMPTFAPGRSCQSESVLVTPRGKPVFGSNCQESIVSLTNRTEPAAMAQLMPPGWKLEAPTTNEPAWSSTPMPLAARFWGFGG